MSQTGALGATLPSAGPAEQPSAAPGELLAPGRTLRLRWLGTRVAYRDAHALQRALWAAGEPADDWLLLLEHPHVYTAGIRARTEHMLVDPSSVGAELLWVDRGGDITYHGPGQVVGYPVLSVPSGHSATPRYIHEVEQLVIETLASLGLDDAGRLEGYPGVWAGLHGPRPRKICAIGARHSRRRTMHGFALNVSTDLAMFDHIVPCGISDKEVTSLRAEGLTVGIAEVVEAIFAVAAERWGKGRPVERQDAAMAGDWPGCYGVSSDLRRWTLRCRLRRALKRPPSRPSRYACSAGSPRRGLTRPPASRSVLASLRGCGRTPTWVRSSGRSARPCAVSGS